MLRLAFRIALFTLIAATISVGPLRVALAGLVIPPKPGPGYKLVCLKTEPVCTWILSSYGSDDGGTGSKGHPPEKASDAKKICQFGGAAQACTDAELGKWSNSQQCYLKREYPPPPSPTRVGRGTQMEASGLACGSRGMTRGGIL